MFGIIPRKLSVTKPVQFLKPPRAVKASDLLYPRAFPAAALA